MKRKYLMFGMALSILSPAAMASPPDTEAVEYYNIVNKHYFLRTGSHLFSLNDLHQRSAH